MALNNSLAEVQPELISEWSEKNLLLTPDNITLGSNKKVWWKDRICGKQPFYCEGRVYECWQAV